MRNVLAAVILNSALLAGGILIVLITCFEWHNFYPLLTILVDVLAITQLMMCGTTTDSDEGHLGIQLSWMLFGLFVVTGYAVPALLWRDGAIPEQALYFTWGGGTVILASMIIYMKLINASDNKYD